MTEDWDWHATSIALIDVDAVRLSRPRYAVDEVWPHVEAVQQEYCLRMTSPPMIGEST